MGNSVRKTKRSGKWNFSQIKSVIISNNANALKSEMQFEQTHRSDTDLKKKKKMANIGDLVKYGLFILQELSFGLGAGFSVKINEMLSSLHRSLYKLWTEEGGKERKRESSVFPWLLCLPRRRCRVNFAEKRTRENRRKKQTGRGERERERGRVKEMNQNNSGDTPRAPSAPWPTLR